jgi:hypothetical protein
VEVARHPRKERRAGLPDKIPPVDFCLQIA